MKIEVDLRDKNGVELNIGDMVRQTRRAELKYAGIPDPNDETEGVIVWDKEEYALMIEFYIDREHTTYPMKARHFMNLRCYEYEKIEGVQEKLF